MGDVAGLIEAVFESPSVLIMDVSLVEFLERRSVKAELETKMRAAFTLDCITYFPDTDLRFDKSESFPSLSSRRFLG